MPTLIQVRCVICHRVKEVNVNDPKLWESPIVRENYVCTDCQPDVKKIKIVLVCKTCKREFHTKVLTVHLDKYGPEWECPICASAGEPKKEVPKSTGVAVDCVWCKRDRGVCPHPEVDCSMAKGFVPFNGAESLAAIKKECTIFSIDRVLKERDDVHTFSYVLLYKAKYVLHRKNLVLIKQRVGSKKAFKTNVTVYRYVNGNVGRYEIMFNQDFERGVNWVKPVKDFIIAQRPDLAV